MSEPITEYAVLMAGGGVHVRNSHPDMEGIYPLERWIPDHQRNGGKVLRRVVIVVEDWQEVRAAAG